MTDTGINWTPLERFTSIINVDNLHADDFMYMGVAYANPDNAYREMGPMVFLYKHCDSRRYLNLDGAGHAYKYDGRTNTYQPLFDALDAVRLVMS